MQASMARLKARGEDVDIPDSTHFFDALLRSGAAELYQASDGEEVLSF